MTDMKIGTIGAGGRMGQACIRQVTETSGCSVVAASDIAGSPVIGNDAGEAAGAGTLGIDVSDDAAAVIVASDTVIEFTLPEPTVDHVALTADAGVSAHADSFRAGYGITHQGRVPLPVRSWRSGFRATGLN